MKTLTLFSLSFAVALGMLPFAPDVAQKPVLTPEGQNALLRGSLPVQDDVLVGNPLPQGEPEAGSEVKVEQEVKAEPEVKVVPEVKAESEVKVVPEVKAESEVKVETEVKAEPEVKVETEVKAEPEVKVETEVKAEPEVKVEPEVKAESEVKAEPEVKVVPEVKAESEVKVETEVKAEPEVKVEPEVKAESEEEMVEEPIMAQEPVMGEEQAVPDAAGMGEGPSLDLTGKHLPPLEEYFPNEEARIGVQSGTFTEEGPEYLINEEPGNEFVGEEEPLQKAGVQSFEEPAMEDSPLPDGGVQTGVVPGREKMALMRQGAENPEEEETSPGEAKQATRWAYCPGVSYRGKCYQFFTEPKKPVDAELFCQTFPGGHLASITSSYIHRQVFDMMLKYNSARTWIGGIRLLETGHFIWLDGEHWSYADWLPGEPNNTADVEDCVELLRFANGQFNDFTCWEPQSFVCSYFLS